MAEHFYAIIKDSKCIGVMQYFTDEEFPDYRASPLHYYVALGNMDTSKIGRACINGVFS